MLLRRREKERRGKGMSTGKGIEMGILRSPTLHLFLLCFVISATSFWISDAQNEPYAMRISCGSREDVTTEPTNTLWYRDFGYTAGRYANATIPSFVEPPLKTLRYFPLSDGPENCYIINNVPSGHYEVRLFFALIADPNLDSEPIFDVSIEGTQVYSLQTGWSTKDEQSFSDALVFVTDTSLSICFHSTGHGNPSILSIEILQVDDKAYRYGPHWNEETILRTVKRLTCGSGKSAFDEDYAGDHWGGDRFWLGVLTFDGGSEQAISTENNISQTSIAPNFYPQKLYQSAIVGTDLEADLSIQIEVEPNNKYSIWLHFAEIEDKISKGERVFDILINGDIIFTNVDIIGLTGQNYTALVLNTTITVSGATLTIAFRPKKGTHAIINAIEVLEVIEAEFKTLADEVSTLRILKSALGLPLRFGWNGDPCVPQQHPWSGINCQFDNTSRNWVIDGLGLSDQGLKGFLPDDISKLQHLQSINFSENSLYGAIPPSLGIIAGLQILDLSFNQLNGSIPDSLGQLASLQILNLNGNLLSGIVPSSLGGRPLHGASFNFTDNAGLCGIPGLRTCGPHLSLGAEVGIAFGVLLAILLVLICLIIWWKRRENTLRAQKMTAAREAPYAKARTHFTRDVQMTKHHRSQSLDHGRNQTESSSNLIT